MSLQHVKPLMDQIEAESNVDALLQMTRTIGVDAKTLQSMLREFVRNLDEIAARAALLKVAPIDNILGADLLQSVAAFGHCEGQKLISKQFLAVYELNQKMMKRMRPRIVDHEKHMFSPQIDHDESINRIFIVHPEEEKLNEEARKLEEQYLVLRSTSLGQCIEESESGDKIYIQGTLVLSQESVIINNKHLQIIGIGEDVNIMVPEPTFPFMSTKLMIKHSNVLFKSLNMYAGRPGVIQLVGSHMWAQDCTFKCEYRTFTFRSFDPSYLYMLSCHIKSENDAINTKSDIGTLAPAHIMAIGCSFKMRGGTHCGEPIRGKCSSLHLVGNRFRNCEVDWEAESKYIRGNVFKGCSFGKQVERVESRKTLL